MSTNDELSRRLIKTVAAVEMYPDDLNLKTDDLIAWIKKRKYEKIVLRVKDEIARARRNGENWLSDDLAQLLIKAKRHLLQCQK